VDHARRALALDAPRGCGHSLAQDKGLCPWLAAASPPRAIAIATRGGRCGGDRLGGPAQQPAESFLGEALPDAGAVSGVPSGVSRVEISAPVTFLRRERSDLLGNDPEAPSPTTVDRLRDSIEHPADHHAAPSRWCSSIDNGKPARSSEPGVAAAV
jgi:hypothetical protein